VNWSLCITQWLEHPYVDLFFRKVRYELGGAMKGDWNYDPRKMGIPVRRNDPHNNRKFTFNWAAG